ncbi:MAG: hypothetical protein KGS47_15525 [Chloroflexi bacterium]|nr:hypothetical protein [Chloroflexota bacterium]
MANHDGAALRQAAERIMAERPRWEGVGLLAIENLETSACGLVLVPEGVQRPDWTQPLVDREPGWDRHEDLNLPRVLQRWAAAQPSGAWARWTEFSNLLNLHVPAALVSGMPAAPRRLACGHGFNVHALPPAADASDLLGRLVAWLLPWERFEHGDAPPACAHWLPRQGVQRAWLDVPLLHGAGGRTCEERVAAGGMREWGVAVAWPSVMDAVAAFLLAQADALDAMPRTPAAGAPAFSGSARRPGRLSKDRRHVVLVAVHEALTGSSAKERPGQERQDAAYRWACDNKERNVHAALAKVSADWCPGWYVERLRDEHGSAVTVAHLLDTVRDADAFATSVRKGMKEKHRQTPAAPVPSAKKAHSGT